MSTNCVWVLEQAIFCANSDEVQYWEVWEACNTRNEAIVARNGLIGKWDERKVPRKFWRIRKYVPEKS